jgi:high affinity choline transporter 7
MSSVDSSLLSGASYLTHNIYSGIWRKFNTSKSENVRIYRISVLILGICSTLLSLSTTTIYGLWFLAGDLGYVVVFPQFVASVFWSKQVSVNQFDTEFFYQYL